MALTAFLYNEATEERRGFLRRVVARETIVRDDDDAPRMVLLHDLSQTGAQIESNEPLALGERIRIGLPGAGAFRARVVNARDPVYGCLFEGVVPAEAIAAAFTVDPVVTGAFATLPSPALPEFVEPVVEKWPPAVRVLVPVVASGLLWLALVQLL